jgi:hypothetical protein
MKQLKSLFFVLLVFAGSSAFTQGNLQFNQVLKITETDQVVPEGKVWKIESYMQSNIGITTSIVVTGCGELSRNRAFFIDNTPYFSVNIGGYGGTNIPNAASNVFPIWLRENQTARTSCPSDFLSVIEFNIIP